MEGWKMIDKWKSAAPVNYDGLMQANLARVFGERDAERRIEAIRELYAEDAVLNEPHASAKGHAAISEAVSALLGSLPPDFVFRAAGSGCRPPRCRAPAVALRTAQRPRGCHRHGRRAFRGRSHPFPLRFSRSHWRLRRLFTEGVPMPKTGLDALLRPQDSILVLIDHQPYQFTNLNSHEPSMIINNVVGLAKTAKVFDVPTILTTVIEERGGYLIKGLQDVFPEQKPIDRTFINTWEDPKVVDIVKKSGRKQLVLAALYTEICLAMPAIQALGEGYDVFIVTDASGGVTLEAHDMAVRRMVAAGAVPITWMAVLGEWQRDWAREKTAAGVASVVLEHGGASGVALAWELQLLAGRAGAGV
jgi:nicotinamidase-related amidase